MVLMPHLDFLSEDKIGSVLKVKSAFPPDRHLVVHWTPCHSAALPATTSVTSGDTSWRT